MAKVKLQNIIFPSPDTCTIENLYFRRNGQTEYSWASNVILLKKNSALYFDTYFNGLSIGKWQKYTKIDDIYITLKFEGTLRITLLRKERIGNNVLTHYIKEEIVESQGEEITLKFEDAYRNGMYTIDLFSVSKTMFYGGYYWTEVKEDIPRIKLALDICTFKREHFVKSNMRAIQNKIFDSDIYVEFKECLEVYVIDNAQTLRKDDFQYNFVHIYPNKNVGGAGGFTRGLIEIKKASEEKGFTHALLMDDDIVLEPESIFRTWVLLSLLKDEYKDAFVGGAMLRLDHQNIQVESGSVWNQGELISRKCGLNLSDIEPCLYNEVEETVDYSAWWYTVLPLSVVRKDNLPLPIFIRGDDVEYGLRNARRIIFMNGICVWHEPFENKYSSTMYYYILRNRLIDNAIHGMAIPEKKFVRILRQWVMGEIYLYRYKNARLLLKGVSDYLKGIDWIKTQNGEEINREVLNQGYKLQYMEDVGALFDYGAYNASFMVPEKLSLTHRVIKNLTINGILLKPEKFNVVIPLIGAREICVYRAENVVHYDALTQKGFVTKRDQEEAKACVKQYKEVVGLLKQKYDQVNEEYKNRSKELMNLDFWNGYLEI